MTETIERDIVEIPSKDAFAVFTAPSFASIDPILGRVRAEIDAFDADVSTAAGRKAIASMAFKISKAKTYIDGVGKTLVDEYKDIPKKIDATRKHVRDTLDAWKFEVRKPLDDWEAAEEERIERIKCNIEELQHVLVDTVERSSECLRDRLGEIERDDYTEARFEEYLEAAIELRDKAIAHLKVRIETAEKREADAAELAKLRKEAEERAARDRDERIAREAAEKAKADAEKAIAAEREAAAKREADLKAAAEKAQRDKEEAEHRAIRAAHEAVEAAEKKRIEEENARALEQKRREADRDHKARTNRLAVAALVEGGINESDARNVITMIARGAVPAVTISY